MTAALVVLATLAMAVLAWGVLAYNRLVRLRNQAAAGWSDIDVQLQLRHDLVPMLVDTVRAYAGHERATLDSLSALRAQAMRTSSPTRLAEVEQSLEGAMSRLLLLREDYPDLKANAHFMQLQRDLVAIEDRLQYARRFYNGAVRDLNDGVQVFPQLLVARMFGFRQAEFFDAPAGTERAPTVEMPQ